MKFLQRIRLNLKFRYMFSYLLAVALPLLVLMFVMYSYFTSLYANEIMLANLQIGKVVQHHYEQQLSRMYSLAEQLSMDRNLYVYDIDSDPSGVYKLQQQLLKYRTMMNSPTDILVYHRGSRLICGATSTYNTSKYLSINWSAPEETQYQFMQAIQNSQRITMIAPHTEKAFLGSEEDVMFFIIPLPLYSRNAESCLILRYPAETFLVSLASGTHGSASAIIMTDEQRESFSCLSSGSIPSADWMQLCSTALAAPESEMSSIQTINGQKHLVSTIFNHSDGILYATATPAVIALSKVVRMQGILFALCGALLLFVLLIVYCIAQRNYKPIHMLTEYMHTIDHSHTSSGDDFERVHMLLVHMVQTHEKFIQRLNANEAVLQEIILYKLITGGFKTSAELAEVENQSRQIFSFPYLSVVSIACTSSAEHASDHDANIRSIFESELERMQIEMIHIHGKPVFILCHEEPELPLAQLCRKVIQALQDEGYILSLGVGRTVSDPLQMYTSFLEAQAALAEALRRGENTVCSYPDMQFAEKNSFDELARPLVQQMHAAIQENNLKRLHYACLHYYQLVHQNDSHMAFIKFTIIEHANSLVKALLSAQRYGSIDEMGVEPSLSLMADASTNQELLQAVQAFCSQIEALLDEQDVVGNYLIHQICETIEANLGNYNFTLAQLAESFSCSSSTLTQKFRRHTGKTPVEYMNELRMQKALHYLQHTSLPIRVITEKIGFCNDSSFIRKFRNTFHMTPNEYRKKLQSCDDFLLNGKGDDQQQDQC